MSGRYTGPLGEKTRAPVARATPMRSRARVLAGLVLERMRQGRFTNLSDSEVQADGSIIVVHAMTMGGAPIVRTEIFAPDPTKLIKKTDDEEYQLRLFLLDFPLPIAVRPAGGDLPVNVGPLPYSLLGIPGAEELYEGARIVIASIPSDTAIWWNQLEAHLVQLDIDLRYPTALPGFAVGGKVKLDGGVFNTETLRPIQPSAKCYSELRQGEVCYWRSIVSFDPETSHLSSLPDYSPEFGEDITAEVQDGTRVFVGYDAVRGGLGRFFYPARVGQHDWLSGPLPNPYKDTPLPEQVYGDGLAGFTGKGDPVCSPALVSQADTTQIAVSWVDGAVYIGGQPIWAIPPVEIEDNVEIDDLPDAPDYFYTTKVLAAAVAAKTYETDYGGEVPYYELRILTGTQEADEAYPRFNFPKTLDLKLWRVPFGFEPFSPPEDVAGSVEELGDAPSEVLMDGDVEIPRWATHFSFSPDGTALAAFQEPGPFQPGDAAYEIGGEYIGFARLLKADIPSTAGDGVSFTALDLSNPNAMTIDNTAGDVSHVTSADVVYSYRWNGNVLEPLQLSIATDYSWKSVPISEASSSWDFDLSRGDTLPPNWTEYVLPMWSSGTIADNINATTISYPLSTEHPGGLLEIGVTSQKSSMGLLLYLTQPDPDTGLSRADSTRRLSDEPFVVAAEENNFEFAVTASNPTFTIEYDDGTSETYNLTPTIGSQTCQDVVDSYKDDGSEWESPDYIYAREIKVYGAGWEFTRVGSSMPGCWPADGAMYIDGPYTVRQAEYVSTHETGTVTAANTIKVDGLAAHSSLDTNVDRLFERFSHNKLVAGSTSLAQVWNADGSPTGNLHVFPSAVDDQEYDYTQETNNSTREVVDSPIMMHAPKLHGRHKALLLFNADDGQLDVYINGVLFVSHPATAVVNGFCNLDHYFGTLDERNRNVMHWNNILGCMTADWWGEHDTFPFDYTELNHPLFGEIKACLLPLPENKTVVVEHAGVQHILELEDPIDRLTRVSLHPFFGSLPVKDPDEPANALSQAVSFPDIGLHPTENRALYPWEWNFRLPSLDGNRLEVEKPPVCRATQDLPRWKRTTITNTPTTPR